LPDRVQIVANGGGFACGCGHERTFGIAPRNERAVGLPRMTRDLKGQNALVNRLMKSTSHNRPDVSVTSCNFQCGVQLAEAVAGSSHPREDARNPFPGNKADAAVLGQLPFNGLLNQHPDLSASLILEIRHQQQDRWPWRAPIS
jgi:hypothetical protein